jgi:hypothetical protein
MAHYRFHIHATQARFQQQAFDVETLDQHDLEYTTTNFFSTGQNPNTNKIRNQSVNKPFTCVLLQALGSLPSTQHQTIQEVEEKTHQLPQQGCERPSTQQQRIGLSTLKEIYKVSHFKLTNPPHIHSTVLPCSYQRLPITHRDEIP